MNIVKKARGKMSKEKEMQALTKEDKSLMNFGCGMFFGVIAYVMWQYNKFLYVTCTVPIIIIWYILINKEAGK